jgi:hypothetical protein
LPNKLPKIDGNTAAWLGILVSIALGIYNLLASQNYTIDALEMSELKQARIKIIDIINKDGRCFPAYDLAQRKGCPPDAVYNADIALEMFSQINIEVFKILPLLTDYEEPKDTRKRNIRSFVDRGTTRVFRYYGDGVTVAQYSQDYFDEHTFFSGVDFVFSALEHEIELRRNRLGGWFQR